MHNERSWVGYAIGIAMAFGIILALCLVVSVWEITKEIFKAIFRRNHVT